MGSKAIILSAPSGGGKTTIAKGLLDSIPVLSFSISACTRKKRTGETDGKDYYFLTKDIFKKKIANDEFLEWEEVYDGQYYGTLKSEVERIHKNNQHLVLDIDVKGALCVKKILKEDALAIFIKPPSEEILIKRLRNRNTESEQAFEERVKKMREELAYEPFFDVVITNADLVKTIASAKQIVEKFILSGSFL